MANPEEMVRKEKGCVFEGSLAAALPCVEKPAQHCLQGGTDSSSGIEFLTFSSVQLLSHVQLFATP